MTQECGSPTPPCRTFHDDGEKTALHPCYEFVFTPVSGCATTTNESVETLSLTAA